MYGPMDMIGSGSMTVDLGDPEAIVALEYEPRTTIPSTDGTGNDTGGRWNSL